MACMVDLWVEKRGVDRQVVVVVGVHGGFVGGDASIAFLGMVPRLSLRAFLPAFAFQ